MIRVGGQPCFFSSLRINFNAAWAFRFDCTRKSRNSPSLSTPRHNGGTAPGRALSPSPVLLPDLTGVQSIFPVRKMSFPVPVPAIPLFRCVGNSELKPHDLSGLIGFDPTYPRPNLRNSLYFPCTTGKSGQRQVRPQTASTAIDFDLFSYCSLIANVLYPTSWNAPPQPPSSYFAQQTLKTPVTAHPSCWTPLAKPQETSFVLRVRCGCTVSPTCTLPPPGTSALRWTHWERFERVQKMRQVGARSQISGPLATPMHLLAGC